MLKVGQIRMMLVTILFLGVIELAASAESKAISIVPAFPKLHFELLVDLQSSPDGTKRLFAVEKRGRVKHFANDLSSAAAQLFIDITPRVNSRGSEEGLLGLAFHPRFKENGYFYLFFTAEPPKREVISRFKAIAPYHTEAHPNSETLLLEVPDPYSNHNGGQLAFGPDGYLYISIGDGGSAGDPHGNGQKLDTLLGKILRIDVDHTQAQLPYSVPADNPFASRKDARGEIFAYGLRNVWRFSFDSLTKQLWAADVGQNKIEEIDIITKGGNYGWNAKEGRSCFKPELLCSGNGLIEPVFEYDHSVGQSITGGIVYRGKQHPSLVGSYLYGDFVSRKLWALKTGSAASLENSYLATLPGGISSFGVDHENEIYICTLDGDVYKLEA